VGKGTAMDSQLTTSLPDRAILIYWRLVPNNGRTLVCTSYRTARGLELRVGVEDEPPVLRADVATHVEARRLSEVWRQEIGRSTAA